MLWYATTDADRSLSNLNLEPSKFKLNLERFASALWWPSDSMATLQFGHLGSKRLAALLDGHTGWTIPSSDCRETFIQPVLASPNWPNPCPDLESANRDRRLAWAVVAYCIEYLSLGATAEGNSQSPPKRI